MAVDHLPQTNPATSRGTRHSCQGPIPRALDHVACHFTSVPTQERSLQAYLALLLVEVRYGLTLRLHLLTTIPASRVEFPALVDTAFPTLGVCCVV